MMYPTAFVLLTAMPPTVGHLQLIRYATMLASRVTVIVNTQPDEPFPFERVEAIQEATRDMTVTVKHINTPLPQEPEGYPGFWEMWVAFLNLNGFHQGDMIVASEMYGKTLAEKAGGIFMPYDLDRTINYTKATSVRLDPRHQFNQILPEFQPNMMRTVTIFGAESVGKTTLTGDLAADKGSGHHIFEWARPYLEAVGSELSTEKMRRIWHGQQALQRSAQTLRGKPFIFQDTDLFSTVGYWKLHEHEWGEVPEELIWSAQNLSSDLYLIPRSNIPFQPDPLRYGGDVREADDQWWIELAEKYNLPYRVLLSSSRDFRHREAKGILSDFYDETVHIAYDRVGS